MKNILKILDTFILMFILFLLINFEKIQAKETDFNNKPGLFSILNTDKLVQGKSFELVLNLEDLPNDDYFADLEFFFHGW